MQDNERSQDMQGKMNVILIVVKLVMCDNVGRADNGQHLYTTSLVIVILKALYTLTQ